MKDLIFSYIELFFDLHLDRSRPLLLAFSGGFDSTVLLHLLIRYKKEKDFDLHIAHIDHGWRKESFEEAKKLEKIAQDNKLVFHMKKLADVPKKNREDICRKKRYEFFSELNSKIAFQAVVLAHQADDVAETVLKRILEGSHLINLSSMNEISTMQDLRVWRPLLQFTRKEILKYIKDHNLSCIDDKTNASPLYLRSRIRYSILPFLTEQFGKEVSINLCLLAQRAEDLRKYLDEKITLSKEMLVRGPLGVYLPEKGHSHLKNLEKTHLVKTLMQEGNIDISRSILEKIVTSLDLPSKMQIFSLKDAQIVVDKRRLFIFIKPLPLTGPTNIVPIKEGDNSFGLWKITLSRDISNVASLGWENLWKGEACFLLPKGNYSLRAAQKDGKYIYPKLKKSWNEKKVPLFLRQHLPILFSDKEIVCDFVENNNNKNGVVSPYYIVKLKLLNN